MTLLESCAMQCRRASLEPRAFVLALDAGAAQVIRGHAEAFGVRVVHAVDDLLSDPVLGESLRRAKGDRSYRAFCWSLASIYTDHIMRVHAGADVPAGELLCYIDSDVMFFDSPLFIVNELAGGSVGCQPHNFPTHELKRLGPNGKYNIGVTAFRANARGREALAWWCHNVLAWCQEGSADRTRWQYCGDQGYMDGVAQIYETAFREFKNPGLWIAPWNLCDHKIEAGPKVDGQPLIAYHFHELEGPQQLSNYPLADEAKRYIYDPYICNFLRWQPVFDRMRK
jgi:hypothetical protein